MSARQGRTSRRSKAAKKNRCEEGGNDNRARPKEEGEKVHKEGHKKKKDPQELCYKESQGKKGVEEKTNKKQENHES